MSKSFNSIHLFLHTSCVSKLFVWFTSWFLHLPLATLHKSTSIPPHPANWELRLNLFKMLYGMRNAHSHTTKINLQIIYGFRVIRSELLENSIISTAHLFGARIGMNVMFTMKWFHDLYVTSKIYWIRKCK